MRKLYILLFFIAASGNLFSQNYTVLGDASVLPGCNTYQITPNQGGQAGAIFQNNTINLNNSFDFTFSNFFGCNGSTGADGEVFVLTTNPNGLGSTGGALGYGGSTQPCSFGIEFDTWQNTNVGDPWYNHTAYESGGQVTHNIAGPVSASPTPGYNLDDCQWHTIEIIWNANTQTMTDIIDGSVRIQQAVPGLISNYLCGNAVVNWGWSAGTGGAWNLQQVRMETISSWVAGNNYQSCTPAIQFTDIATSDTGDVASWLWEFGDGTSSGVHNPLHTYPDTGTYNASLIITDVNGCADTFSHPVHIAAPISLTPTIADPLCNGAQTGSITLAESGGFGVSAGHGGFVYNWNNGAYGPSNTGLGAGTYTVTCTDGICTGTGQYTLNQPTPVTATTSSTNANCGQTNGSCSITISGGTPPYQNVTWAGLTGTTVGNTTTVTGFGAGTYIANFTDANGCSALLQYTATVISLPCGINASTSHTNVTCFGGSNGSVTLTVTGGTPPETITWKNAAGTTVGTGATVSNLPAGTYTYSYTDAIGADAFTGTIVLTQPGSAMVASLVTNNISCGGLSDGRATASVDSGGTSPYSYAWSAVGEPNSPIANNLAAGVITVTVTGANTCTATATGTVASPPPLSLNITTTNNACNAYNNGSAAANVSGGSPPYTYYWNNISTADTDLSLGAGTYSVVVTDSNGCTITGSTTITESPPFVNAVDSTNVLCYGDSTGTITVNSSGGAMPYNYEWSSDSTGTINPALVGGSLTELKAGKYLLTVTDANGCEFFDSTFLQQPASPLSLATTVTNVTCYNDANGSIIITLSGGTPLYTIEGHTVPPGTDTLTNLSPGIYPAVVTDANGCTVSVSDTITQPGPQSLTVTETDNTCNGGHNGSATADFINGTGNVSYDWSNAETGATITNLDSATYSVIATDANGCSFTGTTTVSQPPPLTMTTVVADPPCYGGNGFVTATPANGGTAPFVYAWSVGNSTINTDSVPVGSYTVISTDANSCRQTAAFIVNQPTAITLQTTQTNVGCFGASTGSITVTATGGTGPNYTYTWNPNISNVNTATALPVGAYTVSVTDQAGCIVDTTINITQPAGPLSATYVVTNVACNGATTGPQSGSIRITTTGGTPGYAYAWTPSSASASDVALNLAAGTYSVVITDTNSCTIDTSIVITQPAAPLDTVSTSQTNLTCYNSGNGAADVIITGGTTPYTYVWTSNTSSTTNSATGLAAGSYQVTVTDNNSCTISQPFVITQPTQIVITNVNSNILCFGQHTGSITLTTTGGVPGPGYTYTWNPANTAGNSNVDSSLSAGPYTVTATDSTGCTASLTTTISQAPAFQVDTSSTPVTCFGGSNGTLTVVAAGGVPPFNYSASDGSAPVTNTTGQFTNLTAGTYTVVITDQNGCPDTIPVTVSHPVPLIADVSYYNPSCSYLTNGSIKIVASGGNPSYTFSITGQGPSSMGLFTGLSAGTYGVTVTDLKGCDTTSSVTLIEPDSAWVNVNPSEGTVKLGDTLELTTTTNQTGNITYSWWPNFGLSCYDCPDPVFNGVYSKPYTVTITTDSGCQAIANFTVTVIPNYDFFVPNAFTPNGDGKNDFWQLYGDLTNIKQLSVMVFDRIGEKVFESEDPNFMWDGTFKGKPAPEGVYVYEIKIVWIDNTANSNSVYKGSITLLK